MVQRVEGALETTTSLHDLVVRASIGSYEAVGQSAIPFWHMAPGENGDTSPDVVLPGLRRIEEVETEDTFDALEDIRIESLRRPGMEVWVVVPLSRISDAHLRLRGRADRIQPWWVEHDSIRFGFPRVP